MIMAVDSVDNLLKKHFVIIPFVTFALYSFIYKINITS